MARGRTTRDMSDTGPLDFTEAFDMEPRITYFGADRVSTSCCAECVYGPIKRHFKTKAQKCRHGRFRGCIDCVREYGRRK